MPRRVEHRPSPSRAPADPTRGRRGQVSSLLVVATVAFAIFAPTLRNPFLNWDDPIYIVNDPWIRGWSATNLTHIFTAPYFGNYLPLHLFSYLIDYTFWRLDPFGYHLQAVLLHALNAAFGFVVVRRLFGNATLAFIAALLFAVHPSHVEAVAWISIRKDLLATAFALATVLLYLRATGGTRIRWIAYAASVIAFKLALLSKVSVATLPLFLLALDRWPAESRAPRSWRLDLATKLPFLGVAVWLARLNQLAQPVAHATYASSAVSYAAVKGVAAWNYLGLLLGVLRGSPDYDVPAVAPAAAIAAIAGLLVLPLAAWLAYRRRSRIVALGCVWTFVLLLPALAFPLVTYMADRYLYAPSLGFCWLVAAGVVALAARVAAPRRMLALAGLTLVPFVAFVARTAEALPVWRDSESLWTYALTRCHDNRAYTNLAAVYMEQQRLDDAERLLRASAAAENVTTFQNLAIIDLQKGRYPAALDEADRALTILKRQGWEPGQASVLYYIQGGVYWKLGQIERTIESLEAALREDPTNEHARLQLEAARAAAGRGAAVRDSAGR